MKTTIPKLAFMMFLEWFIWGAWFVPLWAFLSKNGFSPVEIAWCYACTSIAAILSPILVGSLADRFFQAQKVLSLLTIVGALLMFFAAQQTHFSGFFPLLLLYALTYMPTIALTNSIAFSHVGDVERDYPRIRVMGTIGWIASGIAWAVSRAIDGGDWATIRDELPAIARAAQEKRITTFSASMAARIELALQVVSQSRGMESAMQQIYDVVGTGTSTIESVPAAIAMVELAQTNPNRCAILCANLGGDTDTIGAMAVAICGALHGIDAIDETLKAELDAANALDFTHYSRAFLRFRQQREAAYADA